MTQKKQIFIVDDEIQCAETISEILKDRYQTITFDNSQDARNWLRKQTPDLIITDLNMPGENGLEMAYRILSEGQNIPIIAISGFLNKDLALKAIDLGVFDYIEKPFKADDIVECVHRCFDYVSSKKLES